MVLRAEFLVLPGSELGRQEYRAEADPLEARDLGAYRFPKASDFAVASLHDGDRVPGMARGVLVGGVQMSPFFGISPCPKLDLLCLAEPPEDDGARLLVETMMTPNPRASIRHRG